MASLSSSFLSLKEQLLLPRNGDNLNMERERVEVTLGKQEGLVPGEPLYVDGGDRISQQADATVVQVGEKRTARKSSFRICKPQGTFMWPHMASGTSMAISGGGSSSCPVASGPEQLPRSSSCPSIGPGGLPPSSRAPAEVVVASPLDEHVAFRGGFNTPPSASSTNAAAAAKLPPLPSPTSPLQTRALFAAGFTVPALHNFSGLTLRHVVSSNICIRTLISTPNSSQELEFLEPVRCKMDGLDDQPVTHREHFSSLLFLQHVTPDTDNLVFMAGCSSVCAGLLVAVVRAMRC